MSRLTRSLVDGGFLAYDLERKAYRLQAVVMSLAQAFRSEARLLDLALPAMEEAARSGQINVGMAVADLDEMVYLASARWSRGSLFRRIVPGSRVPIENTSLGTAYIAGLDPMPRRQLLAALARRNGSAWPKLRGPMQQSLQQVIEHGWCQATWTVGMTAVATPLRGPDRCVYALNVSFPSHEEADGDRAQRHASALMTLAAEIKQRWHDEGGAASPGQLR